LKYGYGSAITGALERVSSITARWRGGRRAHGNGLHARLRRWLFLQREYGNEDAFDKIGKAIRAYITRNLALPALPPEAPLPAHATDYAGWYEYDASRTEVTRFWIVWRSSLASLQGRQTLTQLSGRMERHAYSGHRHAIPTCIEEKRRAAGSSCDDRTADSK